MPVTQRPLLMSPYLLANGWPEFVKEVRSEFPCKASGGPAQRIANAALAFHPPGIREKIIAGRAHVSRVRRMVLAVSTSGPKCQIDRVTDTLPEFLFRNSEVSGIFSPDHTQGCFDRIPG